VPPSPPPSTAAAPTMGYTKSYTMSFHPEVVRWVPAVAVVLIFILQFFPWVGVYPGGEAAAWQNGWEAAFGSYGERKDMAELFHFFTADDLKEQNRDVKEEKEKFKDNHPGFSLLLFFYFLPFFVVTLVVSVGVLVLTIAPRKLPGALESLMQFRWTLVAGLNLITFLFLFLQLVLGFSIENTYREQVSIQFAREEAANKRARDKRPEVLVKAEENSALQALHRTKSLRLVFLLHVVAIIAAGLMAWVEKRGNRPPPRLVLET
jgi:hypothetical protein